LKANEVTVIKKIKDYSNEAVFKKKAAKAKDFIEKHGIPESFTKQHK